MLKNLTQHCAVPSAKPILATTVLVTGLVSGTSHALEIQSGDYELLPPDSTVFLQYFQYADRSHLYASDEAVASDFNLSSMVSLTRIIKPVAINDNTSFDVNVILPYARLKGSDQAEALGEAQGLGDLIVGGATKYRINNQDQDVISLGTYAYLPTGSYEADDALNTGNNRWKGLLQVAYIKHFTESLALDTAVDVTLFGENDRYSPEEIQLKQAPLYEVQAHLSWKLSPQTTLSGGVGQIAGGETEIEGDKQGDALRTRYARVGAHHWLTRDTQIALQYGQDLSAENTVKIDQMYNLRFAKLF